MDKTEIEDFLEELEDYYIALRRFEKNDPTISLEELESDDALESFSHYMVLNAKSR